MKIAPALVICDKMANGSPRVQMLRRNTVGESDHLVQVSATIIAPYFSQEARAIVSRKRCQLQLYAPALCLQRTVGRNQDR
jgi:hypothetical protein